MASKKKLLQAAAGSAGGAALDVSEVFSPYLYDGTGSAQTITNNIDLSGEGGLVWIKSRNNAYFGNVFDTARGAGKYLFIPDSSGEATDTQRLSSFNSNGFSVGTNAGVNQSGDEVVSWTFRKAPKFFDVVTFTGTGSAQNISHNLGSVPGMIIVKRTDSTGDWGVYHRGVNGGTNPENYRIKLESTTTQAPTSTFWNDTAPTDSVFTVGTNSTVNASGGTYVAYLFAHNNSDGEFGPDSDKDVIKCGNYTGAGATDVDVNLGFEPQWVLIKGTDSQKNWVIFDNMRGVGYASNNAKSDRYLKTNAADAEIDAAGMVRFTATGFRITGTQADVAQSGENFLYMAIRMGPLAQPENGSDVMESNTYTGNSTANHDVIPATSVRTDWVTITDRDGTSQGWSGYAHYFFDRKRGHDSSLSNTLTQAEIDGWNSYNDFAGPTSKGGWQLRGSSSNLNFLNKSGTDYVAHRFQRAPGFFDIVMYDGVSGPQNVTHNLGIVPEMMWIKRVDGAKDWVVYHKDVGITKRLFLNSADPENTDAGDTYYDSTLPTASVVTVGGSPSNSGFTNGVGDRYLMYLFGTVAGVSKVGSFSHTSGSTTNVDCGFSNGTRFLLYKRKDGTAHSWYLGDTARGLVSGDDAMTWWQTNFAEQVGNVADPLSSGFQLPTTLDSGNYIFWAVAT
jgi:hypothetical protein